MPFDGNWIAGRHNRFFELLKDLWQKRIIVLLEEMTMAPVLGTSYV